MTRTDGLMGGIAPGLYLHEKRPSAEMAMSECKSPVAFIELQVQRRGLTSTRGAFTFLPRAVVFP